MLRDYKLSLTFIALILIGYTALVIFNKRPATVLPNAPLAKASASLDSLEEVSSAGASQAAPQRN